jgi:hypothetical protein
MRVAALLTSGVAVAAQGTWGKPLRFREDGTFKIVEVSDVHFTNVRPAPGRNLRPHPQHSALLPLRTARLA